MKLELPPSDNPRRKQWEGFFDGTQYSLDYINMMTEMCDELVEVQSKSLLKSYKQWKQKQEIKQ